MPIMMVVLTLIVCGVVMYLVNAYIPMEANIKRIMNGVVVIAIVIWLLKLIGLWAYLFNVRV